MREELRVPIVPDGARSAGQGAPEPASDSEIAVRHFPLKIAYFVHDLNDPAVRRRVLMLRAGGAEVRLAGFRRAEAAPAEVEGATAIDLGRTHDARLGKRALSVIRSLGREDALAASAGADVVLARNLEMLAIAARARARHAPRSSLVYECLDIHRAMLSAKPAGAALRALERRLMQRVDALIVSSPAFLDGYFTPRQRWKGPSLLVENKVLDVAVRSPDRAELPTMAGPPWRIGWFGVIRCRKSLDMLAALARRFDGAVEVIIRGRPARHVFDDFDGVTASTPHLQFGGPYSPDEIAALYADVHFTWAIDYYEEGQNSSWLLPNRLYEGGLHGAVPLALSTVETGRWLKRKGVGVLLDDPLPDLETFFEALTLEAYKAERRKLLSVPDNAFRAGLADCRELVEALGRRR